MTIRPRYCCALLAIVTLVVSNVDSFPQNNSQINWKPLYFSQNWISNNYNDEPNKYRRLNTNDSAPSERKFIFPENRNPVPQIIADRNGMSDNMKKENTDDSYKILSGSQPSRGLEQSDIIFPGPKSGDDEKIKRIEGDPKCNDGNTFCVKAVDTYPAKYIDDILSNSADNFQAFFGEDELDHVEIGQRIDADTSNEIPLCVKVAEVVYPKLALSKEDKWMYVINQPKYKQGVRIERCLSENATCNETISVPNLYYTRCEQKYTYRHLLAVDDDGNTKSNSFKMPSCCSCVIRVAEGGSATRFGFDNPSSRQSPVPKNKNKS